MIIVLFKCYILTIVLNVCNNQEVESIKSRRVLGGQDVTVNHTFMVYLRRADPEPKKYPGWLCAGALVGTDIVLTSAACVKDIQYLYVIAGYNKYISENITDNQCISNTMKKVLQVCVPKAYDFIYEEYSKWAFLDIAVIKVEGNIVGDTKYTEFCAYAPEAIRINYFNEGLQNTGNDALILGWGHSEIWREDKDVTDYNNENLKYGSTKLYNKTLCAEEYETHNISLLVKKYMICTLEPAKFNDEGNIVEKHKKKMYSEDGCTDDEKCESNEIKRLKNKKKLSDVGICQNDHGGPLIAWERSGIVVIGVASVFKVKNNKCIGPFLFTSTYCISSFLKCVIDAFTNANQTKPGRRSMPDYCYLPPEEKGFEIIDKKITWTEFKEGSHDKAQRVEKNTFESVERVFDDEPEQRSVEDPEPTETVPMEDTYYPNSEEGNVEYETFFIRPQIPLNADM